MIEKKKNESKGRYRKKNRFKLKSSNDTDYAIDSVQKRSMCCSSHQFQCGSESSEFRPNRHFGMDIKDHDNGRGNDPLVWIIQSSRKKEGFFCLVLAVRISFFLLLLLLFFTMKPARLHFFCCCCKNSGNWRDNDWRCPFTWTKPWMRIPDSFLPTCLLLFINLLSWVDH